MKIALITGVTGRDGAYLAEFLLNKGREVNGIASRMPEFLASSLSDLKLQVAATL